MSKRIDSDEAVAWLYKAAIQSLKLYACLLPIEIRNDSQCGIEIVATEAIPQCKVLCECDIFCILDGGMLNKYAAYIWHDRFIYTGLGMLLNNADNNHPANCELQGNKIATTRFINAGSSLRIDYGYSSNTYPPIPKEFLDIRKELLTP